MKFLFNLFFLLFSISTFSQKINSENYYNFYNNNKENLKSKRLYTVWLNKTEASMILKEEMKNAGFEWLSDFRIVKINDEEFVIALCYSEKSKFGFVYESSHFAIPKKENRTIKSLYKQDTGNDYSEKIVSINGDSKFVKIKDLPSNLQIIKEDIYWYQRTENPEDDKYLVTKQDMITILREDIRKTLSSFKK
ncbi:MULTISPECIES: hypothetical protein [unclassified Chryseobacterium]|uniref:hypothetical protein n=1 Tax=unclassified Chryseobacterium TaxID=2593645 RepID=UPI001AE6AF41|nr:MULTISPECIES: hypothetical protein [unclassified Chryseobacterium]MBP1165858.1 sulfur transfer complex TusBCD TusB component (DsrH family) [Chryseobacterium sp. PvR013]MDR4894033.1 hypothetical protein [Chryseobacterium sp. CFS7]